MLSRYAVRTITMELKWIHNVTTDGSVLATASFRYCEDAGRLRLITSLPIITAGAIAGKVCTKFSFFLADSMARTFVLTWLGNKRRIMKSMFNRKIASYHTGNAVASPELVNPWVSSQLNTWLERPSTMCSHLKKTINRQGPSFKNEL